MERETDRETKREGDVDIYRDGGRQIGRCRRKQRWRGRETEGELNLSIYRDTVGRKRR